MERRPLKTRGANWARGLAKVLAGIGITPNQISIASVFFALLSGVFFYYSQFSHRGIFLLFGATCIQLRLICNLMDGMVAIEHNKKTKTGDIFNDVPDRIADFFIIVGAGYAVSDQLLALPLAYTAAAIAITTAYIRVLGASLKSSHYYFGPMAKPHRMALITLCALMEMILLRFKIDLGFSLLYISLYVMVIGGVITCYRRLKRITSDLEGEEQC
ncbi:hypothetical protein A9Q84_01530 [Halobacteriovorax marinus]|uniref:CDP-alcohol phosphatidyltransferase family protein n=1 Tax=Halobacteriovorax marinus TaxID=97084 RepID=A0A1Y5FC03_9BACT|nr:hypothetical protein A9Q84_01530 [Halobacteriovorax marinus]